MLSTAPAYNLKIVLKETGLPADTLRAWERRYGLPAPQRTAGGQRLYSQYDVALVKWLMARQAEGLSISRAVEIWKEHAAAGVDPLAAEPPPLETLPAAVPSAPREATLDSVRARWLKFCMAFEEAKAEQVINKAFAMFPVETVCLSVLQKGLSEIGQMWHEGKVSVQQEHFASALAMRRLNALMSAAPQPTRKQTVIVGCPAGEWHTFAPLLLALLLRRRGWNTMYLGADVPTFQFAETVKSARAQLVVLTAQSLIAAAALKSAAEALRSLRAQVAFGGRIFSIQPDLAKRIPGVYLGAEFPAALEQAEKCLKGKAKPAAPKPAPPKIEAALRAFLQQRVEIEIELSRALPPFVSQSQNYVMGIQYLGDNIAAALQLGDARYVSQEMEWLKTLMEFHKSPPETLTVFIRGYAAAAEKRLNDEGAPIKEWLASQV